MVFKAFIKKGSPVDKLWRAQNRLGGVIHDTAFHIHGFNGEFVAEDFDPAQLDNLQAHDSVQVETFSHDPENPDDAADEADGDDAEDKPRRGRPKKKVE